MAAYTFNTAWREASPCREQQALSDRLNDDANLSVHDGLSAGPYRTLLYRHNSIAAAAEVNGSELLARCYRFQL